MHVENLNMHILLEHEVSVTCKPHAIYIFLRVPFRMIKNDELVNYEIVWIIGGTKLNNYNSKF